MARLPRIIIPDIPLHIIQRGNNRQATFFAEEDYCKYLEVLKDASEEHGCLVHAYVLMTNHIHLLVTPQFEKSTSLMMQAVGRKYVRYINGTYQRSGTLWEGRYKSALVESERYLLMCSRYIELNPVRAGMVKDPAEYRWSSYRANALGSSDMLLSPHGIYTSLGQNKQAQMQVYKALFKHQMDQATLNSIRDTTHKNTVLGSSHFQEEIAQALKRRVIKCAHGGDRKSSEFKTSSELTP